MKNPKVIDERKGYSAFNENMKKYIPEAAPLSKPIIRNPIAHCLPEASNIRSNCFIN